MLAALQALRAEFDFTLEVVDIDMSDELRERYGACVPVVEAQGREICRYFFDETKVISALHPRNY